VGPRPGGRCNVPPVTYFCTRSDAITPTGRTDPYPASRAASTGMPTAVISPSRASSPSSSGIEVRLGHAIRNAR